MNQNLKTRLHEIQDKKINLPKILFQLKNKSFYWNWNVCTQSSFIAMLAIQSRGVARGDERCSLSF